MADNFLTLADKALDLAADAEVLKTFDWTVTQFTALKAILTWANQAEDIVLKIVDPAYAAQIKAAFDSVPGGADIYDKLSKAIQRLKDAEGKIPDFVKLLVKPLSAFAPGEAAGQIRWKIPALKAGTGTSATYAVDLKAGLELDFDGGAVWADDPTKSRRLSIAAKGTAVANAKGQVPYASFSAGRSTDVALTYLYRAAETEIYASALSRRLDRLTNPFNYDSVWQDVTSTDLDGITYTYTGDTQVQVSLTLANALTIGTGTAVNFGVTISVAAGLSNTYTLTLRKTADAQGAPKLNAKLSRGNTDSTTVSSRVAIGVDLASVFAPVTEAVKAAIGHWNTDFNKLLPYLSPGTWFANQFDGWLKQEVGALVKNEGLKAAILADIATAEGNTSTEDDKLIQWLSGEITGAIDQSSTLVHGDIDDAIDRALTSVTARIPTLGQKATDQLKAIVTKAITGANTALKAQVEALFKDPNAHFAKVLESIGVKFQSGIDTFDKQFAPVRDLLNKIDTQLHAIAEVTTVAAKQKLMATITSTEVSTSGTDLEIEGNFTGIDDTARQAFNALIGGDMRILIPMLEENAPETAYFKLVKDKSSLKRYSNVSATRGIDIVFLGFELSVSDILEAKANIEIDGLGNVKVNSDASMERITQVFGKTRTAYFIDGYALAYAGAAKAEARNPVIELGIGATFKDKSLSWEDMKGFIVDLQRAGLVTQSTPDAARTAFNTWSANAGTSGRIQGSLAAVLRLSGTEIEHLLQSSGTTSALLPPEAKRVIAAAGLAALQLTGAVSSHDYNKGLAIAMDLYNHTPKQNTLDYVIDYFDLDKNYLPTDQSIIPNTENLREPDFADAIYKLQYILYAENAFIINRLIELIERLRGLYLSQVTNPAIWTPDKYKTEQTAIARLCAYWLQMFKSIASPFESKITPYTIAFMRVIASLSGRSGVELTLTYTPKNGPVQTVILH